MKLRNSLLGNLARFSLAFAWTVFCFQKMTASGYCQSGEFLNDFQWRKYDELTQAVRGNDTPGQVFTSHFRNLNRIDVKLQIRPETKTAALVFHLRQSPLSEDDLAVVVVEDFQSVADGYYQFRFPPVEDSKEKSFYFFLEASGGGNSGVRVWLNSEKSKHDREKDRQRHENHIPGDGSLDFRAYSVFLDGLPEVRREVLSRLTSDFPFFVVHIGLCLLVLIGIAVLSGLNGTRDCQNRKQIYEEDQRHYNDSKPEQGTAMNSRKNPPRRRG